MERKLQLKDIAAYLPYGLKCHIMGEIEDETPLVFECKGCSIDTFVWIEACRGKDHRHFFIRDIFPLLRPMSDLTKEIEYKGKKIIPLIELAKISMQGAIRKKYWTEDQFLLKGNEVALGDYRFSYERRDSFSWGYRYRPDNTDSALYQTQMYDLLNKLHFDYRGLIGMGLAKDINTI